MKWLKDEKGYTLVTVLLILAVVSVISVSLMTASYSSFKAAKSAETDTQDKLKAERVVDEVTAMIENDLETINTRISSSSMTSSELLTNLHNDLNSIALEKQSECTLTYKTLQDGTNADGTNPNGSITVKVVIEAPVGNARKTLKKVMTLSTISDVFQYTAVTPSDMYLYGAPYISGDVNIGRNLYVTKYATYVYLRRLYLKTSYPAINGNLNVAGSYNVALNYPPPDPDKNLNKGWSVFNSANIAQYFSKVPTLRKRDITVNGIDVNGLINSHKLTWPNNISIMDLNFPFVINTETKSGNQYYSSLFVGPEGSLTINGDLYVYNDLDLKGTLNVTGNIYVGGKASLSGNLSVLGSGHYIYIDNTYGYQSSSLKYLTLKGTMYINGGADLKNDVNTNGSIYVSHYISVKDLSNNKKDSTLVLLCDGDIEIANNNLNQSEPKVMNAYFYSNSQLFIYGVGSNIQINGGIYGKPIILSATKGKTRENNGHSQIQENQDSLAPESSRLSMYFNKDIILNPPDGIPTVNKVSLTEIDTSYVDSH